MNKFYLIFTVVLSALVIVVALGTTPKNTRAGSGEVEFDHAIHVEMTECTTCHSAWESTSTEDYILPKPETCTSCHEEEDVRGYWDLNESAPLDGTYRSTVDRKLRFSHKFHLELEVVECLTCHKSVVTDFDRAIPTMNECYRCHSTAWCSTPVVLGEGGFNLNIPPTAQCEEACHKTLVGLKPQNHLHANFIRQHGNFAENGESQRECAICHSQNFCQQCHTPYNNVPLGIDAENYSTEGSPRAIKIDDAAVLTVQKVHSLTYRYTHGFDARAKSTRCRTCHEPESFCTPCHQNGYDATGVRIVPQSHQLAGFATVGGGEAMNRHGKLAKMDMESCVTCHNVDGGDPVCAGCHSNGAVTGGMR